MQKKSKKKKKEILEYNVINVNLPPGFLNGALQNGSEESDPDITRSSRLFTFDIPTKHLKGNKIGL